MQSLNVKRKRSRSRRIVLIGLILLVIGIGAYFFITKALYQPSASDSRSTTNSHKSEDTSGDGSKPQGDPTTSDASSNSAKTHPQTDSDAPATSKGSEVAITFAGVNSAVFQVRTLIKSITSEGTCTLEMAKQGSGSGHLTQSAGVQAMASSSTCKGFNVPLSSLSSGTWTVLITYTKGSQTSTASKEVVINV